MGVEPKYTEIPLDAESLYAVKVVAQPVRPRRKKGKSCCCWVLIVLLVTLGLFTLLTIAAGAGVYFWVKDEVISFTTDEPNADIPIHDMADAELQVVMDRATLFVDMLDAGQVPEQDLTVSADEINGLIARSDYLRGNAYVEITEGKISVDLSLPATGLPGGKGRYFVASGFLGVSDNKITTELVTPYTVKDVEAPFMHAEFQTSWDNELVVNIVSGKFLYFHVPQDFIDEKENLLEDMDCDDATRIIKGIEGWSIENDKITIKFRRSAPDEYMAESSHPDAAIVVKESSTKSWNYGTRLLRTVLF